MGAARIQEAGLTAAFLVALVEAVGQAVTLPASWDTLPVSTHEVPRDVTLSGEVVAWEKLALCDRGRRMGREGRGGGAIGRQKERQGGVEREREREKGRRRNILQSHSKQTLDCCTVLH